MQHLVFCTNINVLHLILSNQLCDCLALAYLTSEIYIHYHVFILVAFACLVLTNTSIITWARPEERTQAV